MLKRLVSNLYIHTWITITHHSMVCRHWKDVQSTHTPQAPTFNQRACQLWYGCARCQQRIGSTSYPRLLFVLLPPWFDCIQELWPLPFDWFGICSPYDLFGYHSFDHWWQNGNCLCCCTGYLLASLPHVWSWCFASCSIRKQVVHKTLCEMGRRSWSSVPELEEHLQLVTFYDLHYLFGGLLGNVFLAYQLDLWHHAIETHSWLWIHLFAHLDCCINLRGVGWLWMVSVCVFPMRYR